MNPDGMEPLLVFPFEVPEQQALFERVPLSIAKLYLECFDSDGRQARGVPSHVLEALARRLRLVVSGDVKSVDAAFGGQVRRQRNHLEELERQSLVCWAMSDAMEEIKQQPVSQRGVGTPFEIAAVRVGKQLNMSPDNVRRIYKAAKPKKISKNSTLAPGS